MALTFDQKSLPVCCGVDLLPGDPYTVCPRCASRFDTEKILKVIKRLKQMRVGAASPSMATIKNSFDSSMRHTSRP